MDLGCVRLVGEGVKEVRLLEVVAGEAAGGGGGELHHQVPVLGQVERLGCLGVRMLVYIRGLCMCGTHGGHACVDCTRDVRGGGSCARR